MFRNHDDLGGAVTFGGDWEGLHLTEPAQLAGSATNVLKDDNSQEKSS